jgi:hypothetical protein
MKFRLFAALALLPLFGGCDRLTLDNYSRISVGMPYAEVTELIGDPERCDDALGVRNCQWGDEERSVQVSFVGGKAILFASRNLK